jgi:hypothetical protein
VRVQMKGKGKSGKRSVSEGANKEKGQEWQYKCD